MRLVSVMEILFSDQNIIVCIKEVGYDSEKQVPSLLKEQFGGEIFTLHRLDLNVGGIMVYARNKQTAALFSRNIQEGKFLKEYKAMVHGYLEGEGILEDLLWKDSKKNKVFVVDRERKGVKKAKLAYDVLQSGEESLVHIRLYTGRSHQIRVQFSHIQHPLVGDHKYGSRSTKKEIMLYSSCITFPYKGKEMKFQHDPIWAK